MPIESYRMPFTSEGLKDVVRVEKPWGHEIIYAHTDQYVGKILFIKEGHQLSYQYHKNKTETIYVISGDIEIDYAELDLDKPTTIRLGAGGPQSFHLPPNLRHRFRALKNSEVLEVSTPYLDDVVRLEDSYGRKTDE